MPLKKILHLNDLKNKFLASIENTNSLTSKIEDLEEKIKEQSEAIDYLKQRNILLERNNNIILSDFSLLAGSVTEIYNFLCEEYGVTGAEGKKKITYH